MTITVTDLPLCTVWNKYSCISIRLARVFLLNTFEHLQQKQKKCWSWFSSSAAEGLLLSLCRGLKVTLDQWVAELWLCPSDKYCTAIKQSTVSWMCSNVFSSKSWTIGNGLAQNFLRQIKKVCILQLLIFFYVLIKSVGFASNVSLSHSLKNMLCVLDPCRQQVFPVDFI